MLRERERERERKRERERERASDKRFGVQDEIHVEATRAGTS